MSTVRALLEQYDLRPSRSLSQNFLVSERAMDRIVGASALSAQDRVLEVGSGLGVLTRRLAEHAGLVVAVELDLRMVRVLEETLSDLDNVRIMHADILEVDPARAVGPASGSAAADGAYKVVANLPYYITSAVLRHLLDRPARPGLATVMVQREVAQRLVATPGGMSLLAVSVQVFGHPEVVARVPAEAFYPQPKVDSAIVRIQVHPQPLVPEQLRERFFQVVKAGFAQRRKQLVNSLAHSLGLGRERAAELLDSAGIDRQRRAQTLTIEEWATLTEAYVQMRAVGGIGGAL